MAIQQHMSPLLHLVVLAAVLLSGVATSSVVITSTCAAAANFTWRTLYDYCVRTLSANPVAASAADTRGVAAAAANLTASNVTSTLRVLTDLIASLNHCLNLYMEMDEWVAAAASDLLAGRVDTKWPRLRDASYQPGYCELALMEGNLTPKDPVSDENNVSRWLSAMAADIAEGLHDHHTAPPPRLKN